MKKDSFKTHDKVLTNQLTSESLACTGWLGRAQTHRRMAGEGESVGGRLDNGTCSCVPASLCRQSVELDVLREPQVIPIY